MTKTMISMSEIMRVGPWSLRALGYPFGVAERAARLLTWTEAATSQGLMMLRVGEEQIRASTQRLPQSRSIEAGGCRRIDAAGRCLLEIGPPAIDLVTSDLRNHGAASLVLVDAFGVGLIPALADIAARRKESLVILHRAGRGEIDLPRQRSRGWTAVIATAGGPCFLSGEMLRRDSAIEDLRKAGVPISGVEESAILHTADAYLDGGPDADAGHIAITALAAPDAPSTIASAFAAADYPERVARAYREGVEVATVDLHHLYTLERVTWAPTSERSRKQAGY